MINDNSAVLRRVKNLLKTRGLLHIIFGYYKISYMFDFVSSPFQPIFCYYPIRLHLP
ncbi:hypothetical protein LKACC12383_01804 [Companilactobacillus kimchii]|uniref:Uncharacterized protein n=1 Tax=Companilactobacillus kimchii TaxID=2801452 RepID=A0A210P815_9LACO|nr:hypothetical protein LKACC12383_01804 [Companilactobacillus kimchii]